MGEAKRKREQPCWCGSKTPAVQCCWSGHEWLKRPASISLGATGKSGSHSRCYLNKLQTCSDKISGEHLISATILEAISSAGIRVDGFPWQAPGTVKTVGRDALTSNCLCTAHNSALSDLDAAAGFFFRALQICTTQEEGPSRSFLCSGHDIERWMLKPLAALAESRNLAKDGARLPGHFDPTVSLSQLLCEPALWQVPLGLYFTQKLGHDVRIENSIALAPLTPTDSSELVGIVARFQGIEVAMFAIEAKLTDEFRRAYRPGLLRFKLRAATHQLVLSWQDTHVHGDIEYTLWQGKP